MAISPRSFAWSLTAQGASVAIAGLAWVLWTLQPGTDALVESICVVGPPEDLLSRLLTAVVVSSGAFALLVGALDVTAGLAYLRRGTRAWMFAALPVTAGLWLLGSLVAFLNAASARSELGPWVTLAAFALTMSLVHLLALRRFFGATPGAP